MHVAHIITDQSAERDEVHSTDELCGEASVPIPRASWHPQRSSAPHPPHPQSNCCARWLRQLEFARITATPPFTDSLAALPSRGRGTKMPSGKSRTKTHPWTSCRQRLAIGRQPPSSSPVTREGDRKSSPKSKGFTHQNRTQTPRSVESARQCVASISRLGSTQPFASLSYDLRGYTRFPSRFSYGIHPRCLVDGEASKRPPGTTLAFVIVGAS